MYRLARKKKKDSQQNKNNIKKPRQRADFEADRIPFFGLIFRQLFL